MATTDAYGATSTMVADIDLQRRILACRHREQLPDPDPGADAWLNGHIWAICSADDWTAAYASALAADVERPGYDAGVITSAMILTQVQAHSAT